MITGYMIRGGLAPTEDEDGEPIEQTNIVRDGVCTLIVMS